MLTIETYKEDKYADVAIFTNERDEKGDEVYGLTIFKGRHNNEQYVQRAMLNKGQMSKLKYIIGRCLNDELPHGSQEYATRQDRSKAVFAFNANKNEIGIAIKPRHGKCAMVLVTRGQANELLNY